MHNWGRGLVLQTPDPSNTDLFDNLNYFMFTIYIIFITDVLYGDYNVSSILVLCNSLTSAL
jgi:hypothetical protein